MALPTQFLLIYAGLAAFTLYHYVTFVEPDMTWTERAPTLAFVAMVLVGVGAIVSSHSTQEAKKES